MGCVSPREVEATPRPRQGQDPKLVAQNDFLKEELKQKKSEIKELHQQGAAKDRKLDEMQRTIDKTEADRKEARRHAAEVESDRGATRKQLYEKDQELQALQKKHDQFKTLVEEKKRRTDHREEECRAATAEA